MPGLPGRAWRLLLCLAWPGLAAAEGHASPPFALSNAAPDTTLALPKAPTAREFADWVLSTQDASGLPFVVVDKINASASVFESDGRLRGSAPALLGAGRGDDSPPGIGSRRLSTITVAERITPAGRFVAALGRNLGDEDIVWVDYEAAISMHRVVTHRPGERRLERLATSSPLDNRISYGCINLPRSFYDEILRPIFIDGPAVVYVLPEQWSAASVFLPRPSPGSTR